MKKNENEMGINTNRSSDSTRMWSTSATAETYSMTAQQERTVPCRTVQNRNVQYNY